ncbi:MAG: hypothetical protein WC708_08600 [Lentisphaeria bacterium]
MIKERLHTVNVYGKVVDQNGHPVPDAEVEVIWFDFIWPLGDVNKSKIVHTDHLGLWNFSTKATLFGVQNVTKDGYLLDRMELVVNNGFSGDDLYKNKTADNNRIILKLHKMNDPTFVMHEFMPINDNNRFDFSFGEEKVYYYDIVRNKKIEKSQLCNMKENKFHPDLIICGKTTSSTWNISYNVVDNNAELLMCDRVMYDVPDGKYQKTTVLDRWPMPQTSYLYLRIRNPSFYVYLKIEYRMRKNINSRIVVTSWINPFGSRSFEPDPELEPLWKLQEQLTLEGIAALSEGKLLDKEAFKTRFAEAKAEAKKRNR